MTEAVSPAPIAETPTATVVSDPTVRWLLLAVLLTVLVAWWHVAHRLTVVERGVSSVASLSGDDSSPFADPVQCWMFGVGITGDAAKVGALAKGTSLIPAFGMPCRARGANT